ncbi:class I adenylate-forming enzyme family protein [Stella sp.]|uniref:class I adenylate-forming enzyme family protein n=1 Tax=Stella sp. TaxID=2912054 RepID=UPI0035B2E543
MADDDNFVDPILAVAAADGERPAIERDGGVWSYRELARRMAAFASGLAVHGCGRGGVVALVLGDPVDGLVGFLGALLGGAVPVQLDPADPAGERARLAALAGAGRVVTELGDGPSAAAVVAAGAGAEAAAMRAPGGNRPAQINLSSGSTGLRKAAPLSHAQQIQRSRQTIAALGQGPSDRHLPLVPIHFAYGRQAAVRTLLAGGTVVAVALPADAGGFLDLLRARRITHLEATPSHLRYLLERVPDATGPAMPTLRCLSVSTAMLGPAERLAVRRKLTPNLHVTYGSNEMGVVACARPADLDHDPATVGRPLPGCEVRITDEAGNPLPAGRTGEVRVRTANAAGAYLGDPEASGRSFRDGWFLTGDAGRFDAAGCLFLAGRLDDRINFGGIKIYPAEIEDVLRTVAGIADAAVVGMPSPRYQEVPVAAVESAGPVDYPALFAHCRARLAADRMPRTVLRIEALPRTGNGKVDRPALRRLLARRLPRAPA